MESSNEIETEPSILQEAPTIPQELLQHPEATTIQEEIQGNQEKLLDKTPPIGPVAKKRAIKAKIPQAMELSDHEEMQCRMCKRTLTSLKALKYHKRFFHSINKCRHCNKKLLNGMQLKLHTKFKHPEKYNEHILNYEEAFVSLEQLEDFNECSSCHIKVVSKEALLRHHANCDQKCIECDKKFNQKDSYIKHLEDVHDLKITLDQIECPFCMVKYDNDKALNGHIQKIHPEENNSVEDDATDTFPSTSNDGFIYECQDCRAAFSSVKSLNQHRSLKHKNRPKFEEVPQEFKTKNVLKYSREDFTDKFLVRKSNDVFRCLPCQKDIFKRSLILHLRSKHAAIRSFRCEICPDAFFRADYRQRHMMMIHPSNFKCSKCNIQFDRAYKFDFHNNTSHKVPIKHFKPEEGHDAYDISLNMLKYIEDSKSFDYTDDILLLRSNTRAPSVVSNVTTSENPLNKDDFCEKFIVSTSDKVVFCNACQQEIQRSSLISHLLWKHAVQRPLKCAFCNERVVKNNARLTHMARCHPKDYKCDDCGIQFTKYQQIVDHTLEAHQKKYNSSISTGEEEDLHINELKFISNRNEDEIIDEREIINNTSIVTTTEATTTAEERNFGCQSCLKTFTSAKNLLIHRSHKHKNESTDSVTQNLSSTDDSMSLEEFRSNWIEDINETDLKCQVCDLTMKKKNLSNHLKTRHSTKGSYLCEICREAFFRTEQRSQHMNTQHKGMFFCTDCNIQFYRNSRYVHHVKEFHGIELMDSKDRFEVDLNLSDLRFVPTIRKLQCDDKTSLSHSMDHTESCTSIQNADPIEEMFNKFNEDDETNFQQPTNSSNPDELSRNEFMTKYFRSASKDTKHCSACNKTFQTSSLYHHLIHFHATIFPFKCAFCDLRFERSQNRSRHMQVFHTNEVNYNIFSIY